MQTPTTQDVIALINKWHPKKKHWGWLGYKRDLIHYLRRELHAKHHLFGKSHDYVHVKAEHSVIDISIDHRIAVDLQIQDVTTKHIARLEKRLPFYLKYYDIVLLVVVGQLSHKHETELKALLNDVEKRHKERIPRIKLVVI